MFTKAYSPQQSALGRLDDNTEILILYLQEFATEADRVSKLDSKAFTYNWFHNSEENSYILHAVWSEDLHIAIRFQQQHFTLLANLIEPRTIVVSCLPIPELVVEKEEDKDRVSLELSKGVITLANVIFEDPKTFYN